MKKSIHVIKILVVIFLSCIAANVKAQLVVTESNDYVQMVDSFVSSGVMVSNVTYSGSAQACGYFINGNTTNLGADKGIALSTGYAEDIDNGAAYSGSSTLSITGNNLLSTLSGANTYDASVLSMDIVPAFDTLAFSFVFGAEDYPEWVGGSPLFHDYIGAFISGPNPAGGNYTDQNFVYVPGTNQLVTVNNVNATTNSQYFVNNTSGSVMFDGFTTVMTSKIAVVPSSSYQLTLGIADGGDQTSDSGFLLKYQSLTSYGNVGMSENSGSGSLMVKGNPLSEKSTVDFVLNHPEHLRLSVYDVTGRLVNRLTDRKYEPGRYSFPLNPSALQKGLYMLELKTGQSILSSKLVVN